MSTHKFSTKHSSESSVNADRGYDPSEKFRSNTPKQISNKYGYEDVSSPNGTPFDNSSIKSYKRYSTNSTTGDSKKYDDSTPPPRTRMNFTYGAKDEEIVELQRELEQANKRAATALSEQRYSSIINVLIFFCFCIILFSFLFLFIPKLF